MSKRKKISVSPALIKTLSVVIFIFLVSTGIYTGIHYFLYTSDYFRIKKVSGEPAVLTVIIPQSAKLKGQNIFAVDLKKLEQRIVQNNPQLTTVKIFKVYPDQIKIEARLRLPLAQISLNNTLATVDAQGVILRVGSSRQEDLPLITGLKARDRNAVYLGGILEEERMASALKAVKTFKDNKILSNLRLSKVDMTKLSAMEFYLNDDVKVIVDGVNLEKKLNVLAFLLWQDKLVLEKAQYIDLRLKDPVIKDKEIKTIVAKKLR